MAMADCTGCKWYEEYCGREWPDAVMQCNKQNCHFDRTDRIYGCDYFTPKEAKKTCKDCKWFCIGKGYCMSCNDMSNFTPKSKPAEKVEIICNNACRYYKKDGDEGVLCKKVNISYAYARNIKCTRYELKEKPGQATISPEEKKIEKRKWCKDCKHELEIAPRVGCFASHKGNYKPKSKRKENQMIKKLKHIYRMAASAWHYYGIFLLCCFVHPWVYKLWHSLPLSRLSFVDWEQCSKHENAILPWVYTITSIAAISTILYAHHRYTKWYFGDK